MVCYASRYGARILRWWLTAACIGLFLCCGIVAGILRVSLFPTAPLAAIPTAVWLVWYPRRYTDRITVWVDDDTVSVQTGVWWRKHTAVPRTALRTVDLIQTPLGRRWRCVHLVLRFAGGIAVLPFLTAADAHRIGERLS